MSEIITCPSGLTGRIRGMKVREERILADRKLAKAGGQVDELWDAMNLENQGRLVRAIVEKVEIDERSGQVTAVLVDLDLGDDDFLPATLTPTSIETREARV